MPPPLISLTKQKENQSTEISNMDIQFEVELYWCVQQLENALISGKLNKKLAEDTVKNLKILNNCSAPIIRKRQVMKSALGDYRTKMREEEKRMTSASKQIKFTFTKDVQKKYSYVKKSAFLTSGKGFRFNLIPPLGESYHASVQHTGNHAMAGIANITNRNPPSGSDFKFNFNINEDNYGMNVENLAIKN